MASYSQEVLEDVRAGNDIVDVVSSYLPLKQKGGNHFGLCPFHKENSPSFSVSADKQMYYCFGCGAGGNVYSFIMHMENYGFVEAVKHLADRIHFKLPEPGYSAQYKKAAALRETLHEIHAKAARFYYDRLVSDEGLAAMAYVAKRRISPAAQKRFGLGFSPQASDALFRHLSESGYDLDALRQSGLVLENKRTGGYFDRFRNRLMFPIFDAQNKIVGFGGRVMGEGEPKYLNSPDTPIFDKSRNLYGINYARLAKKEEIIVVEGYMDVISLQQAGFHNTVASLGTAFNEEHVQQLKKYCKRVVLLFDSDQAGEKAALRAIPAAVSGGLTVRVLQLQGAKDPDEFIQSFGANAFAETVANALPYLAFQIACARKKYDLSNTEQKVSFTTEAAAIIAALSNSIERDAYIKDVSQSTGLSESAIRTEVDKRIDPAADALRVPQTRNRPPVQTTRTVTKGVDEAKRNVLAAAASRYDLCNALHKHLTNEELGEPVYIRLFEWISERHKSSLPVVAADVVSLFETVEEQRIASIVFTLRFEYESESALLKALNDQIAVIKKAYIDEQLARAEDLSGLQKLAEMKRNLKTLYITDLDG